MAKTANGRSNGHANGAANGIVRNSAYFDIIAMNKMNMVMNDAMLLSRQELIKTVFDPRRNIDDECGYPMDLDAEQYDIMYNREPIAARVVDMFPDECWKQPPEVIEDEDPENDTDFEKAWKYIAKMLRGQSFYQDEEGNPVWEHLERIDKISGIGCYGVLLLGLDDGLPLHEPVDGVNADGTYALEQDVDPKDWQAYKDTKKKQTETLTQNYSTIAEDKLCEMLKRRGIDPENLADNRSYAEHLASYDAAQMVRIKPTRFFGADGRSGTAADYPAYIRNRKAKLASQGMTFNAPSFMQQKGFGDANYEPTDDDDDVTENPGAVDDIYTDSTGGEGQDYDEDPPDFVQTADDDSEHSFTETADDAPPEQKRKLLFLRCFTQAMSQITQYERDEHNPRFAQPKMYLIRFHDLQLASQGAGSIGLPLIAKNVHWSRIIHVADNLTTSEVFGLPRMQQCFNRLLDLRKLYGGSAEMYWKGAFPGYSFESHPQLGGDVIIDQQDFQNQVENWQNGLQRVFSLMGGSMKALAPQVVDPTPQIETQIEAICIQKGYPKRIFMGSERGELASSQDDSTWNERVTKRRTQYITPKVIIPFIDRLIGVGVLPVPTGYSVVWPDLSTMSAAEKAQVANQMTMACAQYITAGLNQLVEPHDYLTHFVGFDDETAQNIIENSDAANQMQQQMEQQQQQDQEMHEAQIEQMTNPDLVPDQSTTQYGDTHQHPEQPEQDAAKADQMRDHHELDMQQRRQQMQDAGDDDSDGPSGPPDPEASGAETAGKKPKGFLRNMYELVTHGGPGSGPAKRQSRLT